MVRNRLFLFFGEKNKIPIEGLDGTKGLKPENIHDEQMKLDV